MNIIFCSGRRLLGGRGAGGGRGGGGGGGIGGDGGDGGKLHNYITMEFNRAAFTLFK